MVRWSVAIAGLLMTAGASLPRAIETWEREAQPDVTEARVMLAARPGEVFAAATDFDQWDQVFRDVSDVEMLGGGPMDAVVRFRSRALGHVVTVRFDNQPNRLMRFTLVEGPPGVDAWGEAWLLPVRESGGTTVVAALHLSVQPRVGLPVPGALLRALRRNKLQSDLKDLQGRFGTR